MTDLEKLTRKGIEIGSIVLVEKWHYIHYGTMCGEVLEIKDGKLKIRVIARTSYSPQYSSEIKRKNVWVKIEKVDLKEGF